MRFLLIALLITPISLRSSGREVMEGWVSDSGCGAKHTKPGGENCIKLCIRGGGSAHPEWKAQKMVLVADSDGKIWTVANPSALEGFKGKHISVSVARRRAQLFVYLPVIVKENNREP
jgi:hypothetical protein